MSSAFLHLLVGLPPRLPSIPIADIHDRLLVAESVLFRPSQIADLGRPGPRLDSQLTAAASYSCCRP